MPPHSIYYFLSINMKRRFKEKQTFTFTFTFDDIFNEDIQYPQLYYGDYLYPESLSLLRNNQFKAFIKKMARHLSPLLQINQAQFFTLIQRNLSIRTSLESCLDAFPRKAYGRYVDSRTKQTKDVSKIKDESFQIYAFLMKITLFIFYRISNAQHIEDKQLTYNQFLLDIPKLLDIAAIYGQSNPEIVRKLIENAYKLHPRYHNDTMDFFNDVYQGKLDQMQKNSFTTIDFRPQSLKSENFGNRQRYMVEKTVLTIFTVKDILFNLTNFFRYFPKRYTYQLATDYKLQEKLVDGVTYFINQIDNQWNLDEYRERYFAMHLEDMRQSMAVYFIEQFKLLKEIMENKSIQTKQLEQQAHNTYQTFCLMLKFKKKKYHKQYQKLINILIEQSQDNIFFLNGLKVISGINKTIVAVDFCQKYQNQYRKKSKIARQMDFDSILNKNKDNLKKYNMLWIDESTKKLNELFLKRQQQNKIIYDYQANNYINKLRYGCKDKQYDDQPQQQQQFKRIQLPNQYVKLDKRIEDLSFYIPSKKKKYIQKKPTNQRDMNLSFNFQKKKDDFGSLSFSLKNHIPSTQDQDLSMIAQRKQQIGLKDLNISTIYNLQIEEDQFNQTQEFRFLWNNQDNQLDQLQDFLQNLNNKEDVDLQNLSFT